MDDSGSRTGGDVRPGSSRPGRFRPGRALRFGRPLLPGGTRPWAVALVGGCAALVVALGAAFAHQSTADALDHAVDAPVVAWFAGHNGLALWLVAPGSPVPAVALSAAIAVACLVAGRLNGALLAATAVPVAEALTEGLIKPLVHRTLLGGIAYPSGHTTAIVALAAMVTVLVAVPLRAAPARRARAFILVVAYAVVAGVAIGLIGLRWHYFTDVVAGAAVGAGTVCALALALDARVVRRLVAADRTADARRRPGPSKRGDPGGSR